MFITDPDTVLIIGAGGSVPFRLPLGGELIDLIRHQLEAEIDALRPTRREIYGDEIAVRLSDYRGPYELRANEFLLAKSFVDDDFYPGLDRAPNLARIREMNSLRERLVGQTSETIDDFIALNSDISDETKIGIATVFFHALYEPYARERGRWDLRQLSSRQLLQLEWRDPLPPHPKPIYRRNWIHHLINIVRHGITAGKVTPNNIVRIINFNYDGILEAVLNEQFNNTGPRDDGEAFGDWNKYIKIVHPHGFMKPPERSVRNPVRIIRNWAETICVVNEATRPEIEEQRQEAKDWIIKAKEVFMVGFAISGPNAEMLGLGENKGHRQEWSIANFDGSSGLRRVAESFERNKNRRVTFHNDEPGPLAVTFEPGTPESPLHIDEWFKLGIAGKMPG